MPMKQEMFNKIKEHVHELRDLEKRKALFESRLEDIKTKIDIINSEYINLCIELEKKFKEEK